MTPQTRSEILAPGSVEELIEIVRATPRLIATGGLTKPRLSQVETAVRVSMRGISGIVEYEPEEFTFTARAGTPVREIIDTLAAKGQHLPFDPMFAEAGSTIGGAVASGVNGPGRLRFGGLRDFILGVRFVDGAGRLLRMGGKVVKNAAGFDVPKFMVGSLGRFGVLTEVTFKVFPSPQASRTLELPVPDDETAIRLLQETPVARWEPRALDYDPESGYARLRIGGPAAALDAIGREILARWPGRVLSEDEAQHVWTQARECAWAHADGSLIKTVTDARMIARASKSLWPATGAAGSKLQGQASAELEGLPPSAGSGPRISESRPSPSTQLRTGRGGLRGGIRWRVSSAGDVSYFSIPPEIEPSGVRGALRDLGIRALTLRGAGPLRPGVVASSQIAQAVKRVMDPDNRFPGIDE
ncbi:MAG: FAD-binding protein [Opitutaceae bacterium]